MNDYSFISAPQLKRGPLGSTAKMLVTCRLGGAMTSVVIAMLGCRVALAQLPTCTYDRCALRLQHRVFSVRVVQGAGATTVARLGWFAPKIEPLATASDSIRVHYEAFRTKQNRGAALTLVGLGVFVASAIVYEANRYENDDVALGLLVVGLPFSIAGGVHTSQARDELQQSIWFYNRSLPRTP